MNQDKSIIMFRNVPSGDKGLMHESTNNWVSAKVALHPWHPVPIFIIFDDYINIGQTYFEKYLIICT